MNIGQQWSEHRVEIKKINKKKTSNKWRDRDVNLESPNDRTQDTKREKRVTETGKFILIMLSQAACGINREMYTVWVEEIKKSGQVGVISGGSPSSRPDKDQHATCSPDRRPTLNDGA